MKKILAVISESINKADVKCLPCAPINLDYFRHNEYAESNEHLAGDLFENPQPSPGPISIRPIGNDIPSILNFFLDGTRRTYKIADLLVRGHYLPIIAGQIGVGVLSRTEGKEGLFPLRDLCTTRQIIAFPDELVQPDDLKTWTNKIIHETDRLLTLVRYNYSRKTDRDPVDLGIAKIMDNMSSLELKAVSELCDNSMLDSKRLLVKDGPLQYKNLKGRGFDVTQFRNVVGLSKSFRPSFTVGSGSRKRDVGAITASLEVGQRTPVFKTDGEDRTIGLWYLRLRPRERMIDPLQGIIKIECYAIDERELDHGLDKDRVDCISSHILRERNVTPYGKDSRWPSHIYPIYLTESFIKSNLLSDIAFQAIF